MAKALQPIALHQTHRAGVKMRPDRFRAVVLGRSGQPFRDLVERVVP